MKKMNERHSSDDNQAISNGTLHAHCHVGKVNGVEKSKSNTDTGTSLIRKTYFTFPASKKKLL